MATQAAALLLAYALRVICKKVELHLLQKKVALWVKLIQPLVLYAVLCTNVVQHLGGSDFLSDEGIYKC